jgi:hypothetical protein
MDTKYTPQWADQLNAGAQIFRHKVMVQLQELENGAHVVAFDAKQAPASRLV